MGEVTLTLTGASSNSKHHMIGGDGPHSYAHNSAYQKELLNSAEDLLQQLISDHLDAKTPKSGPKTFTIAELGCSVGPNAFFAVESIIAAVKNRYRSDQIQSPEFHVFFNDLIGNDFNTLFRHLPRSRSYFAAAAPGSFHARLFPRSAIDLAHCSAALHWLSRAPEAANRGRIHYAGAGEEVREAYAAQYARDLGAFLGARGEEVVAGGILAVVLIGFRDGYVLGSDSSIGEAFDVLGSCLYDLVKMGKISEEEVDTFNLPFYYPSPTELEAIIEANGLFQVEQVAEMAAPMRGEPDPRSVVSHMRAVIGVLVEERFGSGIVDELFELHLRKVLQRPIVDERHQKESIYFVFLKRKAS